MTDMRVKVSQNSLGSGGEDTWVAWKANKLGYGVVMDFYTQMALEERVFNVFAGDITTPFIGDVVLTDTAAEMALDAASGTTIIPVLVNISIRLGTGTLHEYAVKSVAAVGTVGDAFVPQNISLGGPNAVSTARADAAGGVTVAAEVTTTTRRHWGYSNPLAIVTAGGGTQPSLNWEPRTPPRINGAGSLYVQIAATGTGPSYYATAEYIELPTANVS